jgi:hypothetical protein
VIDIIDARCNHEDVESVCSHVFRDGTSSQNSLLFHDQSHTVCELQLSRLGCKCSSFVAIGAADAGTPVCCASRTNDVSEMSPV